jgi:hypothetical protein
LAVSCLVRDAARRLCAPSPCHLWLDVGQSGSFIIESAEVVFFAARHCIVVLVLSGSLPDVVSWCVWSCSLLGVGVVSAILVFLLYD